MKNNDSWSKPEGIAGLIGQKHVDWSVFEAGTTIPYRFVNAFDSANGNIHIPRGQDKDITLDCQGKTFMARLVNVDRKDTQSDTYQLLYNNNAELKEFLKKQFASTYAYILSKRQARPEGDKSYIVTPADQAEYMAFYDTGVPFCIQLQLTTKDKDVQTEEGIERIITDQVMIVAFYLSKYDIQACNSLGYSTREAALVSIAGILRIKRATLKQTRDKFDSVTESKRVGFYQRPLSPAMQQIVDKYNSYEEEALRVVVKEILSLEGDGENMRVKGPLDPERATMNFLYSIDELTSDIGLRIDEADRWIRAIKRKGQAIIYGPPGTGKTYTADKLARYLLSGTDGFTDLVQFHPAYSYEDFVQGIRPKTNANGGIEYPLLPGRFLEFCNKARNRKGNCVLIIDEINRANIARVFGELMYLLEYRGHQIPLSAGGLFSIPPNVLLIGTMNTADRSIALVDHALRRRFAFLALNPNYEVLEKFHSREGVDVTGLVTMIKRINQRIDNSNYEIGISFFLNKDLKEHIADIWQLEIEPYLEEYFPDQLDIVKEFRWEKVGTKVVPI